MLKNCLKVFLVLCALSFFCVVRVCAQTPKGLNISPLITDFSGQPGQSFSKTITVTNYQGIRVKLEVSAMDFLPQGEEGRQDFVPLEEAGPYSLARWFTLPEIPLELAAKNTVDFEVKIKIPDDAPPGGYYAAVFVTQVNEKTDEGKQGSVTYVVPTLGSLFFIRVGTTEEIKERGEIIEFKTDKKFYTALPVNFLVRFENTGNIHLIPKGLIEIKRWGKQVDAFSFNQENKKVLPKSIRRLEGSWKGNFGFKERILSTGQYTMEVALEFGEARQLVSRRISFWFIPLKEIGIAIGGTVLLIVLLIFGIKQYNRWLLQRHTKH
ncbi:hypothetical protein KKB64_01220 [Patescibacteria group bacterium]|nr:hypothetical protein [Patescibacteria group bacterium]